MSEEDFTVSEDHSPSEDPEVHEKAAAYHHKMMEHHLAKSEDKMATAVGTTYKKGTEGYGRAKKAGKMYDRHGQAYSLHAMKHDYHTSMAKALRHPEGSPGREMHLRDAKASHQHWGVGYEYAKQHDQLLSDDEIYGGSRFGEEAAKDGSRREDDQGSYRRRLA